jgi:chalcone isomerase-like protein
MFRGLILMSIVLMALSAGHAAELDGVTSMPDTRTINGKQMQLNGVGLRTYSVLRIYVAGLYLEQRSDNPDEILHSTESKLLDIRFLHDVDAENARKAWRYGFDGNCRLPCHLDPSDVQRFLAGVPSMHEETSPPCYSPHAEFV